MSEERFTDSARALRQTFDESFRVVPAEKIACEDFLAIRVCGEPYAVRLDEVAGLHVDKKIIPFPSRNSSSLGLVGLRGTLTPIHDLGALLGYAATAAPRWLLFVRSEEPMGLGFESFEAHVRLSGDYISLPNADENARRHIRGAVRSDGVLRPLIDIVSVLAALAPKER